MARRITMHSAHMGFWPFGKGKAEEGVLEVDFASRVVAALLEDGSTVRAKLTIRFVDPTTQELADDAIAASVRIAEQVFHAGGSHEELLGREAELGARVLEQLSDRKPAIRSVDLVALHVVGDGAGPQSATPKPPSVAPPRRGDLDAASAGPLSRGRPASTPPRADATPIPRSQMAPSSGSPTRRHSSGQLLAVRAERLIPEHATPEATGKALIPLMRDASTKLLIAVLRSYDWMVVRRMAVDESAEAMEAVVPASSAPLGMFADSRQSELDRWENALGLLKLEALRSETATVTCFLLHQSLEHASVPMTASTTILEKIGEGAFGSESTALSQMGRYLHLVEGSPAIELQSAIIKIVGHGDELGRLEVVLTKVLSSLQEDLSFAAVQAQTSLDLRV